MKIALTRPQFDQAVAHLKQQGITVPGDTGILEHGGVKVQYAYTGTTLILDVVGKPFFIKESYIESQIAHWFATS